MPAPSTTDQASTAASIRITILENHGVNTNSAMKIRFTTVVAVMATIGAASQEQAAAALSMPVHSVKFHLDKLVDAGLLEVEFRRLTGRTGPGAGRPAKLYRRSAQEVALSVPPRRYDVAGEVLAEAVVRAVRESLPIAEAVRVAARRTGRELAAAGVDEPAGSESSGVHVDPMTRVSRVLESHGYEPQVVG